MAAVGLVGRLIVILRGCLQPLLLVFLVLKSNGLGTEAVIRQCDGPRDSSARDMFNGQPAMQDVLPPPPTCHLVLASCRGADWPSSFIMCGCAASADLSTSQRAYPQPPGGADSVTTHLDAQARYSSAGTTTGKTPLRDGTYARDANLNVRSLALTCGAMFQRWPTFLPAMVSVRVNMLSSLSV